jgi:hypothetical protein
MGTKVNDLESVDWIDMAWGREIWYVSVKAEINLLKPSGNFTYDQV